MRRLLLYRFPLVFANLASSSWLRTKALTTRIPDMFSWGDSMEFTGLMLYPAIHRTHYFTVGYCQDKKEGKSGQDDQGKECMQPEHRDDDPNSCQPVNYDEHHHKSRSISDSIDVPGENAHQISRLGSIKKEKRELEQPLDQQLPDVSG